MARQPPVGQDHLVIEVSRSQSDSPQSVGLLWTSDQPDSETSTWQHITLTRNRHPDIRRDSNPQFQTASGRIPHYLRPRGRWDRLQLTTNSGTVFGVNRIRAGLYLQTIQRITQLHCRHYVVLPLTLTYLYNIVIRYAASLTYGP
jgi:hypothetical protein